MFRRRRRFYSQHQILFSLEIQAISRAKTFGFHLNKINTQEKNMEQNTKKECKKRKKKKDRKKNKTKWKPCLDGDFIVFFYVQINVQWKQMFIRRNFSFHSPKKFLF